LCLWGGGGGGGGGGLPVVRIFHVPLQETTENVWLGDLADKLVDHKTNPAIKIVEITYRPTWGGAPSC